MVVIFENTADFLKILINMFRGLMSVTLLNTKIIIFDNLTRDRKVQKNWSKFGILLSFFLLKVRNNLYLNTMRCIDTFYNFWFFFFPKTSDCKRNFIDTQHERSLFDFWENNLYALPAWQLSYGGIHFLNSFFIFFSFGGMGVETQNIFLYKVEFVNFIQSSLNIQDFTC